MSEFKGTKGTWEVIEHNWSDTSLTCGDKTIAKKSIYCDATEETQEETEVEVSANFRLISCAPEMLAKHISDIRVLERILLDINKGELAFEIRMMVEEKRELIKKATTI